MLNERPAKGEARPTTGVKPLTVLPKVGVIHTTMGDIHINLFGEQLVHRCALLFVCVKCLFVCLFVLSFSCLCAFVSS